MICIRCCISAEDNKVMLAENLAVRSVKSHNSNSNCHDAVPRTTRCLNGKTWLKQAEASSGDSVGNALPPESEVNGGSCSAV